ncbi:MAG: LacI family DNA-binding transcriptional regulator [Gaiellaceae bacterium]
MADRSDVARRVTISDIAKRAGVSKGAVSLALNGRPGVSDETRKRIEAIVKELGWSPNRAARSLSAARAAACGLVLARPARMLALEPFFVELIAGIESELSERSIALTIQLVHDLDEEIAVYRRWWAESRVDGVLMVDLRSDDPRVDELSRLGLPAIVIGGPLESGSLATVWHDEAPIVIEVVRYLAALGHKKIARVAGLGEFVHTTARTAAFLDITNELGLAAEIEETDFAPESGARATRKLLSQRKPPTAIVYDSDLLAVTGLGVAQHLGFAVPDDLSIVAWDDSLMCAVVHPPLTAVTRDIPAYGATAARRLLALIDGSPTEDEKTPAAALILRGSTGPAATAGILKARVETQPV